MFNEFELRTNILFDGWHHFLRLSGRWEVSVYNHSSGLTCSDVKGLTSEHVSPVSRVTLRGPIDVNGREPLFWAVAPSHMSSSCSCKDLVGAEGTLNLPFRHVAAQPETAVQLQARKCFFLDYTLRSAAWNCARGERVLAQCLASADFNLNAIAGIYLSRSF